MRHTTVTMPMTGPRCSGVMTVCFSYPKEESDAAEAFILAVESSSRSHQKMGVLARARQRRLIYVHRASTVNQQAR